MPTTTIEQGHAAFRAVLQAMSRPGTIVALPEGEAEPAMQLLSCLLDNETALTVLGDPDLEARLARHIGCRPGPLAETDCIVAAHGVTGSCLAGCRRGSLEYPHTGATVVYLVRRLGSPGMAIGLAGPGIKGRAVLAVDGLGSGEPAILAAINRDFPLGVDAILLDREGRLACIPRSTTITTTIATTIGEAD